MLRIYASVDYTIKGGLNHGLSPFRQQVIIWTNAGLLVIEFPSEQAKYNNFNLRKCFWNCCLQNDGHFISVSRCYSMFKEIAMQIGWWIMKSIPQISNAYFTNYDHVMKAYTIWKKLSQKSNFTPCLAKISTTKIWVIFDYGFFGVWEKCWMKLTCQTTVFFQSNRFHNSGMPTFCIGSTSSQTRPDSPSKGNIAQLPEK